MTASELTLLLQQQLQNLNLLCEKLESELHYISVRNADALMQIVLEKTEILDAVAVLDENIQTLLGSGIPLSNDDRIVIENIEHQLDACKYRTAINQKAVEQGQLRLSHLQHLLNELRAKESLTYDRQGKTQAGRSSRDISA